MLFAAHNLHLQDRFRLTGYDTVHENTDLCTSVVRKGAREPRKGAALQRRLRHAPLAGALGEREGRARPEERLSGETIRATLSRLLGVRWMRGKRWITSPDPLYERKKGGATD